MLGKVFIPLLKCVQLFERSQFFHQRLQIKDVHFLSIFLFTLGFVVIEDRIIHLVVQIGLDTIDFKLYVFGYVFEVLNICSGLL